MIKRQSQLDNRNAYWLKTDKFIDLVSRYTDFAELTTPMLNKFIVKVLIGSAAPAPGRG